MEDGFIDFDDLSGRVLGAAIRVHTALGPGLLESAYDACLTYELNRLGLSVAREVPLRVRYDGLWLDCAYRMDLVVADKLVVEVKGVATLLPVHRAQLLTYLRMSGLPVGLLLNFHVERLRDGGISRIVNNYRPE